jgi:hypothetical protein
MENDAANLRLSTIGALLGGCDRHRHDHEGLNADLDREERDGSRARTRIATIPDCAGKNAARRLRLPDPSATSAEKMQKSDTIRLCHGRRLRCS